MSLPADAPATFHLPRALPTFYLTFHLPVPRPLSTCPCPAHLPPPPCPAQGLGVEQDNATAIEFFKKGAATGHAPSQNGLGFM
eukprot:scaffold2657_cov97-Isochrysis_galbana.AAC.1